MWRSMYGGNHPSSSPRPTAIAAHHAVDERGERVVVGMERRPPSRASPQASGSVSRRTPQPGRRGRRAPARTGRSRTSPSGRAACRRRGSPRGAPPGTARIRTHRRGDRHGELLGLRQGEERVCRLHAAPRCPGRGRGRRSGGTRSRARGIDRPRHLVGGPRRSMVGTTPNATGSGRSTTSSAYSCSGAGYTPDSTSSRNVLAASSSVWPISAYCFTNFGMRPG